MIVVTGGAGFIGSNFVLDWLARHDEPVLNLDKLTYAGNLENLAALAADSRHRFVHGDIGDAALVSALLSQHQPRAILNFAAETHVDRSIHGPAAFIQTNVVATASLLEATRVYWQGLAPAEQAAFRFLQVSTDEVYGSLEPTEAPFAESRCYRPSNPYAASKAAADHLVRSYHQTYGLPVLTTHCSNNYGPHQFPEKLLPLCMLNALADQPLPIYGDGQQRRDWLHVSDHCSALREVLARGRIGETYNIGGGHEAANLDVIHTLCRILDALQPRRDGRSHASLIRHVADRPGHDRRYAIDTGKLQHELGWRPVESFESGIRKTVQWYLEHAAWVANVNTGAYRQWLDMNYSAR